jgi:heme/copper-type cytochrome/quinol oxidase subunit 2
MTSSLRFVERAVSVGARSLSAACVAAISVGCAMTGGHGFVDEREVVQVVSAMVGGKNVYIPSTLVVAANGPRRLSIYNATETIHGFAIRGLGIEVEMPPQQELEVELPPLEGHRIYEIYCHLHGAHRTGALVVLPGR